MSNEALVVLDTMVVSALVNERRDPATATKYRGLIDGRAVVISFVTVTDMRYGALKAEWGEISPARARADAVEARRRAARR